MTKHKRGFTLLEVLIAVIIIAVLATVAWPQYKHAVLKSRFSTVMPMAKAVADAQEVYYLGNNQYALGKEDLDIAPVEAENTQVSLSTGDEEDKYIYVAAYRTDIPNVRYIMYQKNSPKFASNIHCEAKADNDDALWLCEKGLQGTEVTGSGSLQGGTYKTFLLAGNQGDSSFITCPEGATCNEQGTITQCPNGQTLKDGECLECSSILGATTCSTTAYEATACESGYYLDEQTCKQEIPCDNASMPETQQNCSSGCGKQTREVTCNTHTGTWNPPGEWEGTCPGNKQPNFTSSCAVGEYGTKTYTYVCNAAGTGWTTQLVSSTCSTEPLGTYEDEALCSPSAANSNCSGYAFSSEAYCWVSAGKTGCNGNNYTTGGTCYSFGSDSCNGGSYGGVSSGSTPASCTVGNGAENSCSNATFNADGWCDAKTSNNCNNNTFNSGSICFADASNTCSGTYNGTAYCYGSYCPAGSPVAYTNGKTCWDGNGNKGAQYCNGGVTY